MDKIERLAHAYTMAVVNAVGDSNNVAWINIITKAYEAGYKQGGSDKYLELTTRTSGEE